MLRILSLGENFTILIKKSVYTRCSREFIPQVWEGINLIHKEESGFQRFNYYFVIIQEGRLLLTCEQQLKDNGTNDWIFAKKNLTHSKEIPDFKYPSSSALQHSNIFTNCFLLCIFFATICKKTGGAFFQKEDRRSKSSQTRIQITFICIF